MCCNSKHKFHLEQQHYQTQEFQSCPKINSDMLNSMLFKKEIMRVEVDLTINIFLNTNLCKPFLNVDIQTNDYKHGMSCIATKLINAG